MMISRISGNTPHVMNDCCKPQTKSVTTDTITFKGKNLTQLADDIFMNFNKQKRINGLGEILGKTGRTNFRLKETLFGKKAELDIVRGDEFAFFEITRNPNATAKIEERNDGSSKKLVQLVQRFVKGLK